MILDGKYTYTGLPEIQQKSREFKIGLMNLL